MYKNMRITQLEAGAHFRSVRVAGVLHLRFPVYRLPELGLGVYQRHGRNSDRQHGQVLKCGLESNRERINSCIDLVQSHVPKGPILDVGAGGGLFLARISELFPGSLGIEPMPVLYEICRRAGCREYRANHSLKARNGTAAEGRSGGVSMWDVIEHVNDPLALCKRAWDLLRDGGVLIMDTPMRDGLLYGVGEATAMLSRGRYPTTLGIQYSAQPFAHKQIFRKVDMHRMLSTAGFSSVSITEKKEKLSFPGALLPAGSPQVAHSSSPA